MNIARFISSCRDIKAHGRDAPATESGFTVIELLVVITLIVILVLIAVPSFQAMIYSSEEGMAETQVRTAIRAARDAAVRSNGGADGAAVFIHEPGGRCTILPCVKVGEITDWFDFNSTGTETTRRDIFAAAPGFAPVQLPRTWMIRGYVSANSFTNAWYGAAYSGQTTNSGTPILSQRNWVFPETGFFDADSASDGFHRSTFMIRFQAGTGALVGASTEPALVLAPRNSAAGRTNTPFSEDPQANRDGREDPVKFVRTWLAKKVTGSGVNDRRAILGRRSSDMVLARPVMQIALYNEQKLAAALGVRVDPGTGCIYTAAPVSGGIANYTGYRPMYVGPVYLDDIDRWIEGDTNQDGTVSNNSGADRPEAKLYAIDRFTGVLRQMEVQP